MVEIVKNIVEKVKESGMTMRAFERKVGVSEGYFSRCLTYKTKGMNLAIFLKCAEVLGCNLDDLASLK